MLICDKCFKEIIEGDDHCCSEYHSEYIQRRLKKDLERNDIAIRSNNSGSTRNRKNNNTS